MSCSIAVVADSNCVAMVARITCGCAISLSSNRIFTTRTILATSWISVTIAAIRALHMGMATSAITTSTVVMCRQLSDRFYAIRLK